MNILTYYEYNFDIHRFRFRFLRARIVNLIDIISRCISITYICASKKT